jgi:hypothetical protein
MVNLTHDNKFITPSLFGFIEGSIRYSLEITDGNHILRVYSYPIEIVTEPRRPALKNDFNPFHFFS